jgi:hypothetical protein
MHVRSQLCLTQIKTSIAAKTKILGNLEIFQKANSPAGGRETVKQQQWLSFFRLFAGVWACSFALATGNLDARMENTGVQSQPYVPDAGACQKRGPNLDPSLSPEWLTQPGIPGSKPSLTVAHYNLSQGLLAGYEASNGVRILLQSVWLPNGGVVSSATHLNPRTSRLQTFYGPRKRGDPSTGNASAHVQFAGVDVLAYLKDSRSRGFGLRADPINEFLDSESGQAFFEAVPVLYAMLESMETDPRLSALQAPFGVLITGLQVVTKRYSGFPQADSALGSSHADELRANCQSNSCALSGKLFVVHKNGLFDTVSKSKGARVKSDVAKCAGQAPMASPFSALGAFQKNGDGVCSEPGGCFGRCGRGCDGQEWAGNYYTSECYGHDLCVCKWGDAACVLIDPYNPPGGECNGCNDIIDAIVSWLGEVISEIVEWLEGGAEPRDEITDTINFP